MHRGVINGRKIDEAINVVIRRCRRCVDVSFGNFLREILAECARGESIEGIHFRAWSF